MELWKKNFKDLFIYFRRRGDSGRGRESQADSPVSTEPGMGLIPTILRS